MSKEEFEKRLAEMVEQLNWLKEDMDNISKAIPEIEGVLSSCTYETRNDCDERFENMFSKLEQKLKVIELF